MSTKQQNRFKEAAKACKAAGANKVKGGWRKCMKSKLKGGS